MRLEHREALARLQELGWTVELRTECTLPPSIATRYAWLPKDISDFVGLIELVVSPDEKTWLLGVPDFEGRAAAAFAWDEFEKMSLEAALNPQGASAVRRFWDEHLPVSMSVLDGYSYFAVRRADSSIVTGREPEFEASATHAHPSLAEFLRSLAPRNDKSS